MTHNLHSMHISKCCTT